LGIIHRLKGSPSVQIRHIGRSDHLYAKTYGPGVSKVNPRANDAGSRTEGRCEESSVKVLHLLDTYLRITENWLYPQIVGITNVDSRVACSSLANLETFIIDRHRIIISPPSWSFAFGVPRIINSVATRLGRLDVMIEARMRWWRPDVLHAHFGPKGWESIALKRRLNIPLVTSFYGYDAWRLPKKEPTWAERYKELFAIGEVFLVEGPAMRARLLELGCPAEKLQIVRVGVDLTALPYERRKVSNGLKIVLVGRFIEKKGFVDGLVACALARSQGVNMDVTIVGDVPADDTVGQEIKRQLCIISHGKQLLGRVRFTGFLAPSETRSIVKEHNVFLCPSTHSADGDAEGGSPVALTEAMALGLLCLGSRHCDIPELILHEKTGYLFHEGDVNSIADMLCKVSRARAGIREITDAGRAHVEENFSLSTQLNRLQQIYQSVCRGTKGNSTGSEAPMPPVRLGSRSRS
jgi:colanic acid/amylovoran biosynthesis glycosyltransferase